MRMTASWFGSLDLPHTRLWCDSIAPKSGLPSDCHPAARSNRETDDGKNASPCLTQKAPYKGLSADSGEKHEPAGDPDVVAVDSLKALDPNRPIREADMADFAMQRSSACLISVAESAKFAARLSVVITPNAVTFLNDRRLAIRLPLAIARDGLGLFSWVGRRRHDPDRVDRGPHCITQFTALPPPTQPPTRLAAPCAG